MHKLRITDIMKTNTQFKNWIQMEEEAGTLSPQMTIMGFFYRGHPVVLLLTIIMYKRSSDTTFIVCIHLE